MVFYPFILNWVTKKLLQRKVPVKFGVLICCSAHSHWAEGEHYHYVVCYAFQSSADLTKVKNMRLTYRIPHYIQIE